MWVLSDGGSHFKNSLMKDLTDALGIEHHITLPYCPWANGSVEVGVKCTYGEGNQLLADYIMMGGPQMAIWKVVPIL